MGMILRFISACVIAAVVLAGTSLLWPRMTTQPRPQLLTQVRDYVLQTQWGTQAAQVLGVTDEKRVESLSIASIASGLATAVVSTVEQKVQQTVTSRVVGQIIRQFEQMPADQQKQLQDSICRPKQ